MIPDIKKNNFREYVSGKLEPFFSNSDSLVFVLGNEWNIEYGNSSVFTNLGASPEELIGKEFLSILSDDTKSIAEKYLKENSVDSDFKTGIELELISNELNTIAIRFSVSKFNNELSPGSLWLGEKIDKSKKMGILKDEDEILKKFIETSPYGIAIVSNKDTIDLVNKKFTTLIGYTQKDIPNKEQWFSKAYPDPKYREFVLQQWEKYKQYDDNDRVFDVTCKDGSIKKIELRGQKISDKRVIVFFSDLTETLQKQDIVKENLKELSRSKFLIEKSNIELKEVNARLKESEEKLSELNKSKDKFFSILAHDLRSPFSALLSLSNLALSDFENFDQETLKNIVTDINNSAKNFFNLLENLLTWTRITSGRMDFEPVEFDLNSVVDEIVELLKQNAIDKQINLLAETNEIYNCFADQNMVRRILQNLISNAIKFTYRKGEIDVIISEMQEFLKISVKDNGIGLEKEDLNNLFRIDVRQSTKGTEKESGTGLGLILCKELIEKNGGSISVSSTPGTGSEFSFTLKKADSKNSNSEL